MSALVRRIKQAAAKRALARDVEQRKRLVGKPYEKRRSAALKATRG